LATKGTEGAKAGEAGRSVDLAEDIFSELDPRGAEVDKHPVLKPGRAKVAEQLRRMLVGKCAHRLELDNKLFVDEQTGHELTEQTAVLVLNGDWHLPFDLEALFLETVAEGVFVDFLIVTVTEKRMASKAVCLMVSASCLAMGSFIFALFVAH